MILTTLQNPGAVGLCDQGQNLRSHHRPSVVRKWSPLTPLSWALKDAISTTTTATDGLGPVGLPPPTEKIIDVLAA